jgi:hypothetical protein
VDKEKYIKRFKGIYRRKTGKNISDADALARFEKLIAHVRAIYQPIPKKIYESAKE